MYSKIFVAFPRAQISTPVAKGSSVPACPTSRVWNIFRIFETTSWEVMPAGLLMERRPTGVEIRNQRLEMRLGSEVRNQRLEMRLGSEVRNQRLEMRLGSEIRNQRSEIRTLKAERLGVYREEF